MQQRGFSQYILVSVVAILLIASIIIAVSFSSSSDTEIEQDIANAVTTTTQGGNDNYADIVIYQRTATHARGTLFDIRDAKEKEFYAMRAEGDIWRVVNVRQEAPTCETFKALGFEDSMLTDCVKKYPAARTTVSANQALAQLAQEMSLEVIGEVSLFDGITGTVTITDGSGNDFTVTIDETGIVDVQEGDTIIISIIAEPDTTVGDNDGGSSGSQGSNSDSNNTITVTNVINITTEAQQTITSPNQNNNDDQGDNTDTSNTGDSGQQKKKGTTIQLQQYSNSDLYPNYYDIDNSEVEIQVRGEEE